MNKIQALEERVSKIEKRNLKVEADKAWEASIARKLLIALFTYLTIAFYLKFIIRIDPWINAVIPTVGFLLSTLSFPYFKKFWVKYFYKK